MGTRDARYLERDPAPGRLGQGPQHTSRSLGHGHRPDATLLHPKSRQASRNAALCQARPPQCWS
eukprot:3438891-Heterocapsa_arctica.AAC.1